MRYPAVFGLEVRWILLIQYKVSLREGGHEREQAAERSAWEEGVRALARKARLKLQSPWA